MISPSSLRWDVREPYSRIARRLMVDEETVRRRLSKLREDGIIGRFVLFVNPRLVDHDAAYVYLEATGPCAAGVTKRLGLVDGIVSIVTLHGGGYLLDVYYQNEASLARQVTLAESVCGAKAVMSWKWSFIEYKGRMTKTDWEILGALRLSPRRKLPDIASGLEISLRTLNRRVNRMTEGHAFFLDLEFDISKISGLPCLLIVRNEDRLKKAHSDTVILSRLHELAYVDTTAPNYSVFAFHCENTPEMARISSWVERLDGVNEMRLGVIETRDYVHGWIDEEIQRRVASAH